MTKMEMIKFCKNVIIDSSVKKVRKEALENLLKLLGAGKIIGEYVVDDVNYEEIIKALDNNKKIHAIKILRDSQNPKAGLRNSKLSIDKFIKERESWIKEQF